MAETETLKKILIKLGTKPWLKIWRHNTGQAWQGERHSLKVGQRVTDSMGRVLTIGPGDIIIRNAHPVNFGLIGSGDIAGIIAPHGTAIYIETKYGRYKQTEQQKRFAKMIQDSGGIYIVARDPETVEQQIVDEMRLRHGWNG
ncbi:MAG: hypothetical protein IJ545_07005 [Alphaproteobacteria bacterium]|nr:hypothetical protein [Alphaproteobacteria bacterium]